MELYLAWVWLKISLFKKSKIIEEWVFWEALSFPYPGVAKHQFLGSVLWCEGRSSACEMVPGGLKTWSLSQAVLPTAVLISAAKWEFLGLEWPSPGRAVWKRRLGHFFQFACIHANPFNTPCCPLIVSLAHVLALRVFISRNAPLMAIFHPDFLCYKGAKLGWDTPE